MLATTSSQSVPLPRSKVIENDRLSKIEYRQAPKTGVLAQTQPDMIVPQFWLGSWAQAPIARDRFQIDCAQYDLRSNDAHVADVLAQMRAVFADVGLVMLVNTGLEADDIARMHSLVQPILGGDSDYQGGGNARDRVTEDKNVFDVGAPLVASLHYHHEQAYMKTSITALGFMCLEALPDRGATFVSDSATATKELLTTPLGQRLRERGVCYHRIFTDEDAPRFVEAARAGLSTTSAAVDEVNANVYNHFQKSFGTSSMEEAQAIAESKGLVVNWVVDEYNGRTMYTRHYTSAFEYCPDLDQNVLYSSIADTGAWFDTWPAVQHLPMKERPLHMTYGDDSEFSRQDLLDFVALYDRMGIKLDWRLGDIAIVDNYKFAHGRPSIHIKEGERRRLGVMLGPSYARVGVKEDKWPTESS